MPHLIWKMLSSIKNGLLARKKSIIYPYKNFSKQILTVLYREGFICGFRAFPSNPNLVEIFLKYNSGKPVISKILSVSKPGKRVYVPVSGLWKLDTSLQTLILSTPKGVLCDKYSRKFNLGGELLFIIR